MAFRCLHKSACFITIKQSTTFNGDLWSFIDRGIFYIHYIQFENVYLQCFEQICSKIASFALLQKMLKFDGILDGVLNGISPVIICS